VSFRQWKSILIITLNERTCIRSIDPIPDCPGFFLSKKENAGGPDHLIAKSNGFSDDLAAEKYLDPSNGYTFSVLGMGGTTNGPLPSFDLMIHDDWEISTKTYNRPTDAVLDISISESIISCGCIKLQH
jgi:hypothetical protein